MTRKRITDAVVGAVVLVCVYLTVTYPRRRV